jgi:hypothetical protein
MKIAVNLLSKSNKQKNFEIKNYSLLASCQPLTKDPHPFPVALHACFAS